MGRSVSQTPLRSPVHALVHAPLAVATFPWPLFPSALTRRSMSGRTARS